MPIPVVATNGVAAMMAHENIMKALYPNPHDPGCPWYQAAEIVGAPNIKWCEETLCQWISEPANTWSNLLYLVVGIVISRRTRGTSPWELRWMGPAMFLMGAFSLAYHASNNYVSQIFDFIGMYVFVYWLLVINLRRINVIGRDKQVATLVGLSVISTLILHAMYLSQLRFQIIIAVAVVAIVVTEWTAQRRHPDDRGNLRFYFAGLGFVIIAQTASLLDLKRVLCDPSNHVLQGHAVWHVLAAIGLYFAFLHYQALRYSESPPPRL